MKRRLVHYNHQTSIKKKKQAKTEVNLINKTRVDGGLICPQVGTNLSVVSLKQSSDASDGHRKAWLSRTFLTGLPRAETGYLPQVSKAGPLIYRFEALVKFIKKQTNGFHSLVWIVLLT